MRPLPQRAVLLANPVSGGGDGRRRAETALASLTQRGVPATVRFTTRSGEAASLARAACEERTDLLLILGGDGTLRDAVAGCTATAPPLALLPSGTGNDFARSVGIPQDLEAALEVALMGVERRIDVWQWNDQPFLNVAAMGIDAATAHVVNTRLHALKGALAYTVGLAMVLPRYHPREYRLEWQRNGQIETWKGNAWLCAFGNGAYYGGGMRITPGAVPDDGLLDVVIVEGVSRWELLQQFPRIFSGAHIRHPRVRSFQAETVRVDGEPQHVSLDGELCASPPATLSRAHHSIILRAPR